MTISEFIERCDRYCEVSGKKRVWLSKALLSDTFRLQQLADGEVDIGVKRLERASESLSRLEADLAKIASEQAAA